jgi:hypothetical protein
MLAIHSVVGQVMYYFGPISHRRFHQQAGPTCCICRPLRQFIGLTCQEALIGCSMSLDPYSIAFTRKYNSYVPSSDSSSRILVTYSYIRWSRTLVAVTMGPSNCLSSTRTKQRDNSESVRSTRSYESIERFLNCLEIYIRFLVRTTHSLFTSRPAMLTLILPPAHCLYRCCHQRDVAVQGDKPPSFHRCKRLCQAALQSWSCML